MTRDALRVLVVDDEPHARADIVELLAARTDCTIVGTCATGLEAIESVERLDPDVLLLDIRMPGTDGFGVIEQLDATRGPHVIFVTAFDRYAVEAFRVRALDYLLKPVQPAQLGEALTRAREQIQLRATGEPQPTPQKYWRDILVRVGSRDIVVRVDDIDWIEADAYCAQLHVGPRTHTLRERMHVLEARLDPARFVRVHRSAIVNLDRVREIEHDSGDHVIVLQTGARVRTSHARWLEFRDAMRGRNQIERSASR